MTAFSNLGAKLYGWLFRNPKSNTAIVDVADLTPNDRALDVGCGPGAAVELAARRIGAERVSAVDPTPKFVEMVRKRVPGVDVRLSGVESLPFDDETFTAIWTVASMHHWEDRDIGLKEISAKLAPGGRALIAERLLKKPGHGITEPQTEEVSALLRDLGFASTEVIDVPIGLRAKLRVLKALR